MSKIEQIQGHVQNIMEILGIEFDDSTEKTPYRVAKMYVEEIFKGLDENNFPVLTVQENRFKYDQMIVIDNITVNSYCEHHLVPFIGVAHIGYIPNGKVLGLSKFSRVVDYFSRRPQIQEKLTQQVSKCLIENLDTKDIAVVIEAEHFCVKVRGIKDKTATTVTSSLNGKFREEHKVRNEFFSIINNRRR